MAAERSLVDIVVAVIILIFLVGGFGYAITEFDSTIDNDDNLGENLTNIGNDVQTDYLSQEVSVYQQTFNTSTYSIPVASDVDSRGGAQAVTIAKDSPSTIMNFKNAIKQNIQAHTAIWILIGSLISIIPAFLLIKWFRTGR